ncbi:hypothetical protein D3C86_2047940 [compost metagenome]
MSSLAAKYLVWMINAPRITQVEAAAAMTVVICAALIASSADLIIVSLNGKC